MTGDQPCATYVVECYGPGISESKLAAAVDRIHDAVTEFRPDGIHADFLESILMRADETVFLLFDGTQEDVRTVSRRAALPFERVVAALRSTGGPTESGAARRSGIAGERGRLAPSQQSAGVRSAVR